MRACSRRLKVRCRRLLPRWLIAASLVFLAAHLPASRSCQGDDGPGLPEGWKWQTRIPSTQFRGDVWSREAQVRLWVEMGWLIVRRTTADGDFEWQVVLARATDPQQPEVTTEAGNLDIRYRHFFVRESDEGKFRILREPKTADSPPWPSREPEGTVSFKGAFSSWFVDDWRFLRVCPLFARRKGFEPSDFWFRYEPLNWSNRLAPKNDRWSPGGSLVSHGGVPHELSSRNSSLVRLNTVSLEEDLIVGTRVTLDQAARGVTKKALRDCLLTTTPPALETSAWHNTREPIVIENLPAKVVLLDFWSGKCTRSVAQLARVQALQRKYASRGFVVIAIHPSEGSERLADLLKERGVSFPVAIDGSTSDQAYTGESAARYGVRSDPAYFLIGNTGQVELGLGMEPPTEAQIEGLLLQDGIPPPLSAKEWFNTAEPLQLDKLAGAPVLLAFLDRSHFREARNPTPPHATGIADLAAKFGPRGLTVIGVYRETPPGREDVAALLKSRNIAFPVLTDTGETAAAFRFPDYQNAQFIIGADYRNAVFLIGKDGRLRGGLRRAVPTEGEVEALLK